MGLLFMRKEGVLADYTFWIIVAVIVLVIGISAYFLSAESGAGLIEHIKNLIRFGR